ncbi:MAG: gamma-glutamylcyclotransferase family protein [Desulfonatronovibrionaceae bacterium]
MHKGSTVRSGHKVFVYGTLRQGCSNHRLLRHAVFLGPARTARRYSLYVDDFPYLVKAPPVSRIHGEVYVVDDQDLQRLDALENHPFWYKRQEQTVLLLESGKKVKSWIYFFPRAKGMLVESGDYLQSRLCCLKRE